MKYMGNKAALLNGELGSLLLEKTSHRKRFVDLFAGSGSVSHFIAERVPVPVLATDLQHYSYYLTSAVIERTDEVTRGGAVDKWLAGCPSSEPTHSGPFDEAVVHAARKIAADAPSHAFITRHYGGHYFSVEQATALDHLFATLPKRGSARRVAMAVLIRTASGCAAAPGHTAQPFQPTKKLLPYIEASWRRDVGSQARRHLADLRNRRAMVKGLSRVSAAQQAVTELSPRDLVFCDPPYSDAQYSRFYHVLEGIAVGGWPAVEGNGRSPALVDRKSSSFSLKSGATTAMSDLLCALRERECEVIVTFPDRAASNGLSADAIEEAAASDWRVGVTKVQSTHSTLGGSTSSRGGRRLLEEAVIHLSPRG